MSDQPLVTKEGQRGDNSPSFEAKQNVNDSTGKVLAIVSFGLSCVAVGAVAMMAYFFPQLVDARFDKSQATIDINSNRAQISENHWREIETRQGIQQHDIDRLTQELRNVRR